MQIKNLELTKDVLAFLLLKRGLVFPNLKYFIFFLFSVYLFVFLIQMHDE